MTLRPELERFAQEHAIRQNAMHKRHDVESAQLWAEWNAGLQRLGADQDEANAAFHRMINETFPAHNETRHRFYQENPYERRGRRTWYQEHLEFKDEFESPPEGGAD
jgi:transketolase